jgi:hypothetical protein
MFFGGKITISPPDNPCKSIIFLFTELIKLGPSPPAIALKYLISLPSTTTIPHSKLEGQIKGVGPTVFH